MFGLASLVVDMLNRERLATEQITARPHAYPSRENDDVRSYLLARVQSIASQSNYIHVSDDTFSNASFVGGKNAAYFEGTNILVKVDGTDSSTAGKGVLFSAHYDSVSTGYGATDDGMGIITLLQLVEYYSVPERRPRRTAVFFLNNGEEDGLNGAHLFYENPWSNETATFVNLEGAGAGGCVQLFASACMHGGTDQRVSVVPCSSALQASLLFARLHPKK